MRVLFLCTGNSCRSQIAEAIMNHRHADRFQAFSAGSQPDLSRYPETKGVHPMALETLSAAGINKESLYSKSWDQFINGEQAVDFVFTLCDSANREMSEVCPVFPGQPISAHWGVPDPAMATGSREDIRRVFENSMQIISVRIQLFASLPLTTLEKFSLQTALNNIGHATELD